MIDIIDILRKQQIVFSTRSKESKTRSNIIPAFSFQYISNYLLCLFVHLSFFHTRERESFNLELVLQILYYKHGNLAVSCCVLHPPIPPGQGRGKGRETNDDLYNSLVKKRYIMKTPTSFQKSKKISIDSSVYVLSFIPSISFQ